MIRYDSLTLDNGLRVLLHQDNSTPLVAVNVLYDVGSRDEVPERTGFAHLFEHLMFGGSDHAPSFDDPIQEAGGECNAFTNSDITNFYSVVPRQNLELALFLEADRMENLTLNERKLAIQRDVVVEEFKETCLNQPYGDMWHLLAPMAFEIHPYRWPTIGKSVDHIAEATIDDVANFYAKHYGPDNAIVSIAGNIDTEVVAEMTGRLFGNIAPRLRPARNGLTEPVQTLAKRREQHAPVPVDAIYIAFHMSGRDGEWYYTEDLISDILASGKSSRLYDSLLKDRRVCSQVDAYITGTSDPGLLIVEANPADGTSISQVEEAIWDVLHNLRQDPPAPRELERQLNKIESSIFFSNSNVLNKAMNLAYFELIGHTDLINTEHQHYRAVSSEHIAEASAGLFSPENSTTLVYLAS